MNNIGQAAVTDSLYFILIVTFLSIFLFGFANSYGSNVREQINGEFSTTFATNALKVILYSSTPRDVTSGLSQNSEVDYLLAILKEDYSDDEAINENERRVLGKTISSILSPIDDTSDYAFYITIPSERKFVFMYLHLTNFEKTAYSSSFQPVAAEDGRFFAYSADKDKPHTNYFCAIAAGSNPADAITIDPPSEVYTDLSAKIAKLVTNVGPTSQASSSIKLVKEASKGAFDDFKAQVDLVLWDAVWLEKTDERQTELFPYDNSAAWNCTEAV